MRIRAFNARSGRPTTPSAPKSLAPTVAGENEFIVRVPKQHCGIGQAEQWLIGVHLTTKDYDTVTVEPACPDHLIASLPYEDSDMWLDDQDFNLYRQAINVRTGDLVFVSGGPGAFAAIRVQSVQSALQNNVSVQVVHLSYEINPKTHESFEELRQTALRRRHWWTPPAYLGPPISRFNFSPPVIRVLAQ